MAINGDNGPAPTEQRPTPPPAPPMARTEQLLRDAADMGMMVIPTRDLVIAELRDDVAELKRHVATLLELADWHKRK